MTELSSLLVPILLSSVIVFIASTINHMLPLWHRGDFPRNPGEDRVMDALRPLAIPPGDYMMPRASSMADMSSPAFLERVRQGPVMMLTVMPNRIPSMARNLSQWFVYIIVVAVFVAYVGGRALPPGVDYLRVFQIVGATAFIAYSVALWQMSIWYARSWSMTIKTTVDGLIYALLTAGVFGWLWPR
jgi:hypothetical protein